MKKTERKTRNEKRMLNGLRFKGIEYLSRENLRFRPVNQSLFLCHTLSNRILHEREGSLPIHNAETINSRASNTFH